MFRFSLLSINGIVFSSNFIEEVINEGQKRGACCMRGWGIWDNAVCLFLPQFIPFGPYLPKEAVELN